MIHIKQGWQIKVTTFSEATSEQSSTIFCKTKQDAQFLDAIIDYATAYTDSHLRIDKIIIQQVMLLAQMYPNSLIDSNYMYQNDILKADIEGIFDQIYFTKFEEFEELERYIKHHQIYYVPNEIKIDETKFDKKHSM